MARYKVKGESIDAMQYTGTNAQALSEWCGGKERNKGNQMDEYTVFMYPSIDGGQFAIKGQYIIKKRNGSLMHMNKDTFESMYELAPVVRSDSFDTIRRSGGEGVMFNRP